MKDHQRSYLTYLEDANVLTKGSWWIQRSVQTFYKMTRMNWSIIIRSILNSLKSTLLWFQNVRARSSKLIKILWSQVINEWDSSFIEIKHFKLELLKGVNFINSKDSVFKQGYYRRCICKNVIYNQGWWSKEVKAYRDFSSRTELNTKRFWGNIWKVLMNGNWKRKW